MKKKTDIYAECSVIGPPGPIGGGAVIVTDGEVREIAEDFGDGSTHQAALKSILMALNALQPEEMDRSITVWTKSKYAAEVISETWDKRLNLELVSEIKSRFQEIGNIRIAWHGGRFSGGKFQQRAKQLAWETIKHRK